MLFSFIACHLPLAWFNVTSLRIKRPPITHLIRLQHYLQGDMDLPETDFISAGKNASVMFLPLFSLHFTWHKVPSSRVAPSSKTMYMSFASTTLNWFSSSQKTSACILSFDSMNIHEIVVSRSMLRAVEWCKITEHRMNDLKLPLFHWSDLLIG